MRLWPVAMLLLVTACGSQETKDEAPPAPAMCQPSEVALPNGQCIRPGVPIDGCAEGFEHDGDLGCVAVLPAERCADGSLAVPGEATCHTVMSCGTGPWGDIPTDASTVFVDQSYPGSDSDGSASKPFTTIGAAYLAAADSALIAIAEGSYVEDVRLLSKPVRLVGRCPELVEVVGVGSDVGAVVVGPFAGGTVVRGLALTGPLTGVTVAGAQNVSLQQLWVHDTGEIGILSTANGGITATTQVSNSLVERSGSVGIFLVGGDISIDASVVRDTALAADGTLGRGLNVDPCRPQDGCSLSQPAHVALRRSLIDNNHQVGIHISGSDAAIIGAVIRNTQPDGSQKVGRGINVRPCEPTYGCPTVIPAQATLEGVLVEGNRESGVLVEGSQMTIRNSVIRGTLPEPATQWWGGGVAAQACPPAAGCDPTLPASLLAETSLIELNYSVGVTLVGGDLSLIGVAVRDTQPRPADLAFGRGLSTHGCYPVHGCDAVEPAYVSIVASLVQNSHEAGVGLLGGTFELADSVVQSTRTVDGVFGDGVAVMNFAPSQASLSNVAVNDSERAGVANFGSMVTLQGSSIHCASFDLNGEELSGSDYIFDDRGGNVCGCDASDPCAVVSAGLSPPDATDVQ